MINYRRAAKAIKKYQKRGYTYVDTPWIVSDEAIAATLPPHRKGFELSHPTIKPGKLVGSAEQGFIQMMLDDALRPGHYVSAGPCFRDEEVVDRLHQYAFFKVELISLADHRSTSTLTTSDAHAMASEVAEVLYEMYGYGARVVTANRYYNEKMSAFSIPAAEHSTITSWGREREVDAYRNMLTQYAKPDALVAVVSDSYDIYNAVENLWGGELRQQVIDSGATLVVRPDSGEPSVVVRKCLELLDARFGHTVNSKGYKVLNHVKVIQGDGINEDSLGTILYAATKAGYSTTNLAFGMGGALLQQHNRDTQKFAMKCSSVTVNGELVDVFKDPVDDHGKHSKKGRLDLTYSSHHGLETERLLSRTVSWDNTAMRTVYEDGQLLVDDSLETIRARANVRYR